MKRTALIIALSAVCHQALAGPKDLRLTRDDGQVLTVRLYEPAARASCAPLAVLSHGAGGSEEGLEYLAESLSDSGWRVMVPAHAESSRDVLKQLVSEEGGLRKGLAPALMRLTGTPAAYQARFSDIHAAVKWSEAQCHAPVRMLAGHSMGAATTLMAAGARNLMGISGEDRFDGYIALSPQGTGQVFPDKAWSDIRKPVLLITGTEDKALEGSWETRLQAYANMPAGCKWQVVIDGASHRNLGGGGFARKTRHQVEQVTMAFATGLRSGVCGQPPAGKGMSVESK